MRAYSALGSFDTARPFGPWINRIAVNTALNWLQRRRVPTVPLAHRSASAPEANTEWQLADDSAEPERVYLAAEQQTQLRLAILALPPHYRAVIELRHFQELIIRGDRRGARHLAERCQEPLVPRAPDAPRAPGRQPMNHLTIETLNLFLDQALDAPTRRRRGAPGHMRGLPGRAGRAARPLRHAGCAPAPASAGRPDRAGAPADRQRARARPAPTQPTGDACICNRCSWRAGCAGRAPAGLARLGAYTHGHGQRLAALPQPTLPDPSALFSWLDGWLSTLGAIVPRLAPAEDTFRAPLPVSRQPSGPIVLVVVGLVWLLGNRWIIAGSAEPHNTQQEAA